MRLIQRQNDLNKRNAKEYEPLYTDTNILIQSGVKSGNVRYADSSDEQILRGSLPTRRMLEGMKILDK